MSKSFECSNCQPLQVIEITYNRKTDSVIPHENQVECENCGEGGSLGSTGPNNLKDLKAEFQTKMIELADEFDSLDHDLSPDGKGSELQYDVQRLREFARELAKNDELLKA